MVNTFTLPTNFSQLTFSQAFDIIPECSNNENNSVYLTTSEENQEATLETLSQEPLVGNTILATSGFFALNAIAARGKQHQQNLDYIVMIDYAKSVQTLWEQTSVIIKQNAQYDQAKQAIEKLVTDKTNEFWSACTCDNQDCKNKNSQRLASISIRNLNHEIQSGISWLSSQPAYEKVKHIFDANHFVFKRIDLFDAHSVRMLSQTINQLGLTVDTIYLSNIREYAEFRNRLPDFHTSMSELSQSITDKTLVVETQPRPGGIELQEHYPLHQRIIRHVRTSPIPITFPPSPAAYQCPHHGQHLLQGAMPIALTQLSIQAILQAIMNGSNQSEVVIALTSE